MTRNQFHSRSHATRRRLGTGLAALAALMIIVPSTFGGGVDAARNTKSSAIANVAGDAVVALDRWEQTLNPLDYVRFVQRRDQVAAMTEADIEVASGVLRDSWSQVSLPKQAALLSAISQLGVPYRSLASKPGVGFDCSGLTTWAFGQAGIELPRVSRDQIRNSDAVDREDAVAGDLVYYPGHVSIYLGAGLMVHSPNSGSHVEIRWLPEKSLRFGDAASAYTVIVTPPSTSLLVDGPHAIAK